jgi:hypothetical protein
MTSRLVVRALRLKKLGDARPRASVGRRQGDQPLEGADLSRDVAGAPMGFDETARQTLVSRIGLGDARKVRGRAFVKRQAEEKIAEAPVGFKIVRLQSKHTFPCVDLVRRIADGPRSSGEPARQP